MARREQGQVAKRRRRSGSAGVRSYDIRDALARGAVPPTSSTALTPPQEAALVEWGGGALQAAKAVWDGCPKDACPLLRAANLALIPTEVLAAFGFSEVELVSQPQLIDIYSVKNVLHRAALWAAAQNQLLNSQLVTDTGL